MLGVYSREGMFRCLGNKAPGGYSEGHLLALKNQLFPWLQIEPPVCLWCVYVCVKHTHIF